MYELERKLIEFLHFSWFLSQFEDAVNRPDPNEIRKLVDPRLGDNYPFDSVVKVKTFVELLLLLNS